MRFSVRERRMIGLEFREFLEETRRSNITDVDGLRHIYETEFRQREDGTRYPNLSGILYALTRSSSVRIRNGQVYFSTTVRVAQDQWARRQIAQASPGGDTGPQATLPSSARGSRAARKRMDRAKLFADKNGIEITSDRDVVDGVVRFDVENPEEHQLMMIVDNTGQNCVVFLGYSFLRKIEGFVASDENRVRRDNHLLLCQGDQHQVTVRFRAPQVGVYLDQMVFEFKMEGQANAAPFYIVRDVEASYQSSLVKELAPTEPYRPLRISPRQDQTCTVDEGVPPVRLSENRLVAVVPLPEYKCPDNITEFSNNQHSSPALSALLKSPLCFENYTNRFSLLLHLEVIQMEVDIRRYDMQDVPMVLDRNNKNLLVLEVPGVAENRPSVLRGDHLLVTKKASPSAKYKGYVHRVELEKVKLGFSKKFLNSFYDNMKFSVEFTLNHLAMKLQQRSVRLAVQHGLKDVLFPEASQLISQGPLPKPSPLSLYDRSLEQNPEQRAAVSSIVAGLSRPAPYLIFGPPGTGKTVTMVEAIKQVVKLQPSAHVLACAPSNSASDQLCQKVLEHVDSHKVYRLYASSRTIETIPEALLHNCNLDGECHVFPAKEELMEYKVMVTTLITAGRLVTGGVPLGHFTHVFVDEAGHAEEPQTLIAVAGLLQPGSGQVVLAGDPKQLGPILRSPLAIKHGLGLSLLERLMTTNPLYQDRSDNRFVTKLLQNYRSHEAILKTPNEMYYEGELQVCADEIGRSLYCNWEHLPQRNFPVIFHGVKGVDDREGNSPSFFNRSEIEFVVGYLKKLLHTQGKKGISKISPKDIGIITPYRKQVEKIRQAIWREDKELKVQHGIRELKVGSVEEFQGQERRVIIISAVRSSEGFIQHDLTFNIGFLKDARRFNVAMTRAKALLIVVGNPVVLRTDPTWGRFIDYCAESRGYTGVTYSTAEGPEEVVKQLALLTISVEEPMEDNKESLIQQYIQPEWKNEH